LYGIISIDPYNEDIKRSVSYGYPSGMERAKQHLEYFLFCRTGDETLMSAVWSDAVGIMKLEEKIALELCGETADRIIDGLMKLNMIIVTVKTYCIG
jgi:hypothetical protein